MKKIYCIVISEFDKLGNRINAWEMSCNTNFTIAKEHWKQYDERLKNGEFSFCGKNSKVELEVRDYETNDLIEIIEEV